MPPINPDDLSQLIHIGREMDNMFLFRYSYMYIKICIFSIKQGEGLLKSIRNTNTD